MEHDNRALLSPVLAVAGDLPAVRHCKYGSLPLARRHPIVEFRDDLGVTINVVARTKPFQPLDHPDAREAVYGTVCAGDRVRQVRKFGPFQPGVVEIGRSEGRWVVEFNSRYRLWAQTRVATAASVGELLTDLAQVAMLRQGVATLHGGVVSRNGSSVLVSGLPNVGKTTTIRAFLDTGYSFQSEDIALVSGRGETFGTPFTSSMKITRGVGAARRNLERLVFKESAHGRANLVEHAEDYTDTSMLSHVIILQRGRSNEVKRLAPPEARDTLLSINRIEFGIIRNPLLSTWLYCQRRTITLDSILALEKEVVDQIVGSRTVHRIRATNARVLPELIEEARRSVE